MLSVFKQPTRSYSRLDFGLLMMVLVRHHSNKTVLQFLDLGETMYNEVSLLFFFFFLITFVSFRNDGSIFDGLVEEDDKDKAKR